MASPNTWSGGFNLTGTVFENGPETLSTSPSYLSGAVQFLDTINGYDGSAGSTPQLPVKTLAQAVTNSAANGLIVIGEGSSETLSGSQAVSLAGLAIVGCGTGSSRPRYTCSGSVVLLNVSGAGVYIENLYFPASSAAATARIDLTSASCQVVNCYFECGASDTNQTVRIPAGGSNSRIEGCTFAVTASRPAIGLVISGAATDCWVVDTTFDGGSFGWSDAAFKVTAASLRLRVRDVSLINQAGFSVTITGTSYQLYGLSAEGTCPVVITA